MTKQIPYRPEYILPLRLIRRVIAVTDARSLVDLIGLSVDKNANPVYRSHLSAIE